MREYFKNLPDETTPLTGDRLNGLLNGEESVEKLVVGDIECKNLLKLFDGSVTYEGRTWANNNNTIKISGTSTGEATINIIDGSLGGLYAQNMVINNENSLELEAGTYTLSIGNVFTNGLWYLIGDVGESYNECDIHGSLGQSSSILSYTFTISSSKRLILGVYSYSTTGETETLSNVQLEKGTVATPFAPYKKIGYNSTESMGKIVVDDISCKNVFNADALFGNYKTSDNLYTFSVKNFYYVGISATPEELGVKRENDYIFSINVLENENNISAVCSIVAYNETQVIYERNSKSAITGIDYLLFNLPLNTTRIELRVNRYMNATTNTITVSDIQIEKGTVATEYTPFKGLGYTSGSNENGSWVKYDDGRMECYGVKTLTNFNLPYSYNGVYYNDTIITLPATFTDAKYTVVESCSAPTGLPATNTGNKTTTTFSVAIKNNAQITFDSIDVNYIAKGYWK